MSNRTSLRNGLRVLIVDGDIDSRELLETLFALHEVETVSATCVREALEKISEFQPDLLISELILPNEDGYSLIEQLKHFKTASSADVPAIALTVCAGKRDRIQALAAGFRGHLPKPVDIEQLTATVACLTDSLHEHLATSC